MNLVNDNNNKYILYFSTCGIYTFCTFKMRQVILDHSSSQISKIHEKKSCMSQNI